MSSTQTSNEPATELGSPGKGDFKLEVVIIPVSDVVRTKR